ncbi:S8 family serine peptidase [Dongia sp.]|uniref:S8 family serine peptidase n=1 Tax=Dongia sp. TaxID=1977262 RepID=UPI0035B21F2B
MRRFFLAGILLAALAGPAAAQVRPGPAPGPTPTIPNTNPNQGPAASLPDILGTEDEIASDKRKKAGGGDNIPNEICVIFAPGTDAGVPDGFAGDFKLEPTRNFTMSGLGLRVYLMRVADGANPEQVFERAAADQRPLWVQKNYIYQSSAGDAAAQQYALQQIRADAAAAKANGGSGVKIGLIDSGVDLQHESLRGAHIKGIDVVDGGDVNAETHGTVIASILVGQGPLHGVAPAADLIAVRAFHEVDPKVGAAQSSSFLLSQGIDTAVREGAQVINLSLTGPQDRLVGQMVNEALMHKVSVIAAAGNEGPKAAPAYPAAQDGVIAVTATDAKDHLYKNANRGDYISVAAPGVDILGAKPGGSYDFFSGTSMATGYVTGVAALMMANDHQLTVTQLRKAVEASAVDLGPPSRDPEFGAGRIDAASALEQLP